MNSDLFSLKNKTAIVTGSTPETGLAIAEQFCREGASCVISSKDVDAVEATANRSGVALPVCRLVFNAGTTITDGS